MPGRKTRRWAMVRTRLDGSTDQMPEYGARFEPSAVPGDMLDCFVPVVVVVAITSDVELASKIAILQRFGQCFWNMLNGRGHQFDTANVDWDVSA
jgi:hypothetical protein